MFTIRMFFFNSLIKSSVNSLGVGILPKCLRPTYCLDVYFFPIPSCNTLTPGPFVCCTTEFTCSERLLFSCFHYLYITLKNITIWQWHKELYFYVCVVFWDAVVIWSAWLLSGKKVYFLPKQIHPNRIK